MIDPRHSPVAMLPTLNAIAGHMIARHAPLRKVNVEDTEQAIAEVADLLDINDAEAVEIELNCPLNFAAVRAPFFYDMTLGITWGDRAGNYIFKNCLAETFLMALDAHIEEMV